MRFHEFNKQCIVINFIKGLGQIDSAQIHSTTGYYMAVNKFANGVNGMTAAEPFFKTKLVFLGYKERVKF